MSRKKCVNNHSVVKTLWSWPIWQNCCQETIVKKRQWAHKDWKINQWNKTHWTDESMFEIFGSNTRVYVWRRVGERAATPCIISSVKHGGWSAVMCGAFANRKVGDLHEVKNKLNQFDYHSTLQLGRTIFSLVLIFGGKNAKNLWSSDSGKMELFW